MKKGLLILVLFFSREITAQQLYFGFNAGPNVGFNQIRKGDPIPPDTYFKNRVASAQSLFFELQLNFDFAIAATVRNSSFGYITGVIIEPVWVDDRYINCSGRGMIGFNYVHYDLSFVHRNILYQDKIFWNQKLSFGWMPTWNIYGDEETISESGCENFGHYIDKKNAIKSNVHNFYLNLGLGLELRVFGNKYLTLDLNYLRGFREISYMEAETHVNGQVYHNRISVKGSYACILLGFKIPLADLSKVKFRKKNKDCPEFD